MPITNPSWRDGARDAADEMLKAFVWDSTPQGHKYWQAAYERLRLMSNGQDTDEAAIGIPRVEVREITPESCGLIRDPAMAKRIQKVDSAIFQMMPWSETPQGGSYWLGVAGNCNALTGYCNGEDWRMTTGYVP
jgi:hypothetical protein